MDVSAVLTVTPSPPPTGIRRMLQDLEAYLYSLPWESLTTPMAWVAGVIVVAVLFVWAIS